MLIQQHYHRLVVIDQLDPQALSAWDHFIVRYCCRNGPTWFDLAKVSMALTVLKRSPSPAMGGCKQPESYAALWRDNEFPTTRSRPGGDVFVLRIAGADTETVGN